MVKNTGLKGVKTVKKKRLAGGERMRKSARKLKKRRKIWSI